MKNIIGKQLKVTRFHKDYIIKISEIKEICNQVYSVTGFCKDNKKFTLTYLQRDMLDNLV